MNAWIPTSHKMPPEVCRVLFFVPQISKIFIGARMKTSMHGKNLAWYADGSICWNDHWVSHWMPLPEVPR